jgi:hypothetical protein
VQHQQPVPAAPVCVAGSCNPILGGLVAYWAMDEATWVNDCTTPTVRDSSGNGHDGLACPALSGPTAGAMGKFGQAGSFDGTTERYIDVAPSPAWNNKTSDFTISLWVNFNSLSAAQPLYDAQPNNNGHLWLVHRPATGWSFEQRPVKGANTVIVQQGSETTATARWNHVALVRAGDTWTIYLNGDSVATAQVGVTLLDSTDLHLGWGYDGQIELNGLLDDYRIYSRALTADEVRAFSL